MFVIVAEGLLAASPADAWAFLLAFRRYATWTAAVEIEGEASRGAALDYRVLRGDRTLLVRTLPALVTEADPPRRLAWSLGAWPILRFDFAFELEPAGAFTKLRHRVLVRGFVSNLRRGVLERMLGPTVRMLVADAEHALRWAPAQPSARPLRRSRRRIPR